MAAYLVWHVGCLLNVNCGDCLMWFCLFSMCTMWVNEWNGVKECEVKVKMRLCCWNHIKLHTDDVHQTGNHMIPKVFRDGLFFFLQFANFWFSLPVDGHEFPILFRQDVRISFGQKQHIYRVTIISEWTIFAAEATVCDLCWCEGRYFQKLSCFLQL